MSPSANSDDSSGEPPPSQGTFLCSLHLSILDCINPLYDPSPCFSLFSNENSGELHWCALCLFVFWPSSQLLVGCFLAVLKLAQNHHRLALAARRDRQEASAAPCKPPHHHGHLSLPNLSLGVHPSLEVRILPPSLSFTCSILDRIYMSLLPCNIIT